MIGNSMEEGLMQQLKNPSHDDPARFAAMAGMAAGLLSGLLSAFVLPAPWAVVFGFFAAVVAGVVVHRRLGEAVARRQSAASEARREAQQDETRRAIARMREETR